MTTEARCLSCHTTSHIIDRTYRCNVDLEDVAKVGFVSVFRYSLSSPLSVSSSWEGPSLCTAHTAGRHLGRHLVRGEGSTELLGILLHGRYSPIYYYLLFLCISYLFIYQLFKSVWTHGYLCYMLNYNQYYLILLLRFSSLGTGRFCGFFGCYVHLVYPYHYGVIYFQFVLSTSLLTKKLQTHLAYFLSQTQNKPRSPRPPS